MDSLKWIILGLCVGIIAVHGQTPESTPEPEPEDPVYYGTTVGALSELAHDVAGMVHVLDENRIMVTAFHYDGQGPDTFFFVGTSGTPSANGILVPHTTANLEKLGVYSDQMVVLTLPQEVNMADIVWFSVWCRQATANFGSVMFPANLMIPAAVSVGMFMNPNHGVSGTVTIINHKQFRIENFMYDGSGPDAYFYIGEGPVIGGNTIVPNEEGSMSKLLAYTGQTIVITLPAGHTVYNIDWLSVWCEQVGANFGYVMIPAENLLVPVYLGSMMPDGAMGFMGTPVGALSTLAHDVSGMVFIVNATQIRIYNLNYDGEGPDAYFYVGFAGVAGVQREVVSSAGMIINNEQGNADVLESYSGADIVLTLPEGKTVRDVYWLSIWCESFNADFGNVIFPEVLGTIPASVSVVAGFTTLAHEVASGAITFINERQVHIVGFTYDGQGPDAFFWVGNGDVDSTGMPIPDENGGTMKLPAYANANIVLTLPAGMTWADVEYLSVWCAEVGANFGFVTIPQDNILLPPFILVEMILANCQSLDDFFQLRWEIMDDYIYYEFAGNLEGADGYMSMGQSGSTSVSTMGGADVMVAFWAAGMGSVVDYKLTAYAQCNIVTGDGACPDEFNNGNSDNAEMVTSRQMDEFTYIRFRRRLVTGDAADIDTPADGNMFIVWAMGILGNDGRVTKHNLRQVNNQEKLMTGNTCRPLMSRVDQNLEPWDQEEIAGPTTFTAQIGPSGGARGYLAITGTQSWGIAWWINGYLIPEITLQRGIMYTFTVEGGADVSNNAEYHPFYLTADAEGGYAQKTATEQAREVTYAGVMNGQPTAAGRLCEFKTSGRQPEEFEEFADYKATLNLECDPGTAATLYFTPDDSTPDEIFYQCFTHRFLGWKIKVVDEILPNSASATSPLLLVTSALAMITVVLSQMLA